MAHEVRNNVDLSRYELVVDENVAGIADYRLVDQTIVIPHTEIDSRRRGQGLGAVMVKGVLDDVRTSGRTVVPQCWFVAQYIDQHPEYRDLVAGPL